MEVPPGTRTENPIRPHDAARAAQDEDADDALVAIASAGAGVVALAVGTIFALQAHSNWNDAKGMGCDDSGVCRTQAGADLVNDAGSKATIGTIGISAGIVLIAGGAALWFFTPTPEREAKAAVTPSVSVGPGGAQLGVVGRF